MPQIITPSSGSENPTTVVAHSRSRSVRRRLILPIVTALFVLVPAGNALACGNVPEPQPCDKNICDRTPTPAFTEIPTPNTSAPEVPEGDDTSEVVTGNPGFTG